MAIKKKVITPENALIRLEEQTSRADYCRYEIEQKLYRWGVEKSARQWIIESLEERRFVDDHRFAVGFTRSKLLYNRWGRRKIRLGLMAKRVSADIIEDALGQIDEPEYREILRELLASKARTIKEGNTYEGRTKLFRFGVTRGFEAELVAAAIRGNNFEWIECVDSDEE